MPTLYTFPHELMGASVQQYVKKVAMHSFYMSVPDGHLCQQFSKSTQRAFSTKNTPTHLNNHAYSNSFTSRHMILSHVVCYVSGVQGSTWGVCACWFVRCVISIRPEACPWLKASRRWHPPCLPSAKTRDTTSLHARLYTTIVKPQ